MIRIWSVSFLFILQAFFASRVYAYCDPNVISSIGRNDPNIISDASKNKIDNISISTTFSSRGGIVSLESYLRKASKNLAERSASGLPSASIFSEINAQRLVGAALISYGKSAAPDNISSPDYIDCGIGGEWVVFEGPLERVRIEGAAVQDPSVWNAVTAYEFERTLAINANSPPVDNSPSNPGPGESLPKEERCENIRRQCVADATVIANDLKEICNIRLASKEVSIPIVTGICKAAIDLVLQSRRDNGCLAKKIECLTS